MSLFKSLGKAVKKVVKTVGRVAVPAVTGFLAGGPVGAIVGAAGSLAAGRPSALPGGAPLDLVQMAMPPGYMANPPVMAQRLPIPRAPTLPAPVPRVGGGVIRGPGVAARMRDSMGRILKQTPVGWLPRVGRAAARAAGWIAIGAYYLDGSGNVVGVRISRRMNPLNARALRRAISRVKGATKICREVERITTPRRRSSSSSRKSCAPSITQVR